MPDEDQKTAEKVAKRLLGTMKKYTHTVQLRDRLLPAIVIEHDEELRVCETDGVAGKILRIGYSEKPLFVRMDDVLYYRTDNNTTE